MYKFLFSSLASAIALAVQPVLAEDTNLEQITVTASRVEIPRAQTGVSVSVLTAADIEKLGYSTLLDVVKTLPGISVSNNGGLGKVSNVYVRGESGSRTLVLLDGVNVADPTNTQVTTQFQHLQAGDVERIEVLRGPQGMMYGAGAGGVINIITKRAAEPLELRLSAEGGRYDTARTQLAARGKRDGWNYAVNFSQLESDGFNTRENDLSGERDGYQNQSASARLGYAFSDSFSLDGQLRQIDAETEFDGCYAGWLTTNNCEDLYTQTSYQLGASLLTGAASHRLTASRQQLERDSLSDGASSYAVEGAIDELNYFANARLGAGEFSWGADLDRQEYDSAGASETIDITGVFGEWRGDLAEAIYYSAGFRHDRLDNEDHNSWRFSVAVPQLVGENHQLKYRASASTGFRAPSPYEVSYNLVEGVAPVGPEQSRGYELGLEYAYAQSVKAELVAFRQTVTDAIIFDSTLGSGWGAYAQDNGDSRSQGFELSFSGGLGESGSWYSNGTWLDSEDAEGEQRLNVPQQVYNVGASYSLLGDRLTVSGNWRRVADRLSPAVSWADPAQELGAYDRVDLNAVYDFSERVAFTLRGENLLDEDYREVAGFYTAGAAVYAGVKLSLN
ncbi:TonB-dependent siderophore receptor [uncultured Microbulbifer sp.]|uniref:TonB-dependent receptor plug domain-containing protein n=1 Tax=uncultured Microbulbifer sp. TaxID=348147 RepID=UPI0025DA1318|nr:TonB-dependent receptor [uncultured Microbulbifer sp.]